MLEFACFRKLLVPLEGLSAFDSWQEDYVVEIETAFVREQLVNDKFIRVKVIVEREDFSRGA